MDNRYIPNINGQIQYNIYYLLLLSLPDIVLELFADEYMEEQNWTPLPPNASGCFVASPFASETSSRMDASGPRSSQNLLVTASVPSVHGRLVVAETPLAFCLLKLYKYDELR